MTDPLPIACRQALEACAHVLHGRAVVLRGRTPDSTEAAHGRVAAHDARSKHAGRLAIADGLDRHAERLLIVSRQREASSWPACPAELLGHLVAMLMGGSDHHPEVAAECAEIGRRWPAGLGREDWSELALRALGVPASK